MVAAMRTAPPSRRVGDEIQGGMVVACVLTLRRGIVGELAAPARVSL